MRIICDGGEVPDDFNCLLAVFIPKGVKDHDTVSSCERTAAETRPLGMKNSDNKIMIAVVDTKIQTVVQQRAHHAQKGFVKGSSGTTNIVQLDGKARVYDLQIAPPPLLRTLRHMRADRKRSHTQLRLQRR